MSNSEEIIAEACSSTSEALNIDTFDGGTNLTTADLEGPSGVLLVDPSGNVVGDLSLSLDPNQMPIFITHVAKASDTSEISGESIIELSEVHGNRKRKRETEEDSTSCIKDWLSEFQDQLSNRLKLLEEKASALDVHCQYLFHKTQNLVTQVDKLTKANNSFASGKGRSGTIIVGVPPTGYSSDNDFPIVSNVCSNLSSSFQLITQNTEADYPDGSWLGNPEDPEMRVRCPLSTKEIDKLTQSVTSGEKMALILLDYLFDRETQACSNISGNSKHGKKQLDPLKIYGIKCHVMYHFGVDDNAWQRIKLNLDSKCRTAFRRKLKGMPLTVKAFREIRESRNSSGGSSGCSSYSLIMGQPSSVQGQVLQEDDKDEILSRLPSLAEEEEEEEEEEREEQGAARVAAREFSGSTRTYSKYHQPRLLPKSICSFLEKKALILEEEEDETSAVLSLMEAEEGEEQLGEDTITIHQAEGATLSLPLSHLYGEPQVLFASAASQLIQTENGDFQLLQATPEQLVQIQQGHPIQILTAASANPDLSEQDPC